MGLKNIFKTSQQYGNTGNPKGKQFILKHFQGVIIHPDGVEIPQSYVDGNYKDLIAYMQTLQLNDPETRFWHFPAFFGTTETTEAAEIKKAPYGNEVSYTENPQGLDAELENKGNLTYRNIRKFLGRTDLRAIFYQEDAFLYESTNTGIRGCEVSITPKQVTIDTKADYSKQMVSFQIKDPRFLSDNFDFIQIESAAKFAAAFEGILDVTISEPATNVVKAVTTVSQSDLYDLYSDELAVVGAWVLTNTLTGAESAPTTVAKNNTYKGWTITHAIAAPVTIRLASPSVLATLGIGSATMGGYEAQDFLLGE